MCSLKGKIEACLHYHVIYWRWKVPLAATLVSANRTWPPHPIRHLVGPIQVQDEEVANYDSSIVLGHLTLTKAISSLGRFLTKVSIGWFESFYCNRTSMTILAACVCLISNLHVNNVWVLWWGVPKLQCAYINFTICILLAMFVVFCQIRGFMSRYHNVLPASRRFDKCTACSETVSYPANWHAVSYLQVHTIKCFISRSYVGLRILCWLQNCRNCILN